MRAHHEPQQPLASGHTLFLSVTPLVLRLLEAVPFLYSTQNDHYCVHIEVEPLCENNLYLGIFL